MQTFSFIQNTYRIVVDDDDYNACYRVYTTSAKMNGSFVTLIAIVLIATFTTITQVSTQTRKKGIH